MTVFSKEWVEQEDNGMVHKFSIKSTFNKLKTGESTSIICEGFGITKIINNDDVCFVEANGRVMSYEELTGNKMEKEDSYRPLIYLFIVIFIAWLLAWFFIVSGIPPEMQDGKELPMTRGVFGDMFGSINALFSGLALGGIIFTILLQKKELKLQRKELRDTRKEFSVQNDTLRRQRFENTFFQLINLHHEIVGKLVYGNFQEKTKIQEAVTELKGQLNRAEQPLNRLNPTPEKVKNEIIEAYKFFYYEYESILSHYLRNIYHIFKYVFKSNLISEKDKYFYASIVRAQLSHDELFLIFYNSFIEGLGNPNFLFLMKEFNILDNFNFDLIKLNHPLHVKIFKENIKDVENPF